MKSFYIYILANKRNGTLYIGVTSDLIKRVWEHKGGFVQGFTKRYGIKTLVYYEVYLDIRDAIEREKRLKNWSRLWKLRIIEEMNPEWKDLYEEIIL